jgi:flagellar hook-associated protein 2
MALSSQGIGSGLDVNSIVTQLVAIEKQPLTQLQTSATKLQTQLSLYGSVKSQMAALGDAAAALALPGAWNTQKASSSNASAVGVTAGASATAGAFSVSVSQLARAQSAASTGVAAGSAIGAAGTLSIQLGTWSGADTALGFTPGSATAVAVSISATDTTSAIAAKINAAGAGVTATVLKDGTNERLVIRSSTTGQASGFAVSTSGDAGLAQFAVAGTIDSTNPTPASGMYLSQTARDAKVKIDGVEVISSTNKISGVIAGLDLQLSQVTTAPVEILVENDTSVTQKNIQTFVDTYNAINQTLANATKYDASTKTGGPLQGDSTTVGLQSALRSMMASNSTGSTFTTLSEVGLERQADGSLKVNSTKLTAAMGNLDNLKKLFATDNSNASTNGFGLKVRDFTRGLLAVDGRVSNKSTALQGAISRNSTDQDAVNTRAARVEASLRRQYSALDAKMAEINGLNSYVSAQIAQWNKASN